MKFTTTYIISQICAIITYIFLALTYYAKTRKNVLIMSLLSNIINGIEYILLNAYSGFAMCMVASLRCLIFLVDENKNGDRIKNGKKDVIILIILCMMSIILGAFTYEGIYSILPVLTTILYTYSAWQKNVAIYKILGVPVGILWIAYNVYIKSIFGVILESIIVICSITGYILHISKKNELMPPPIKVREKKSS